MELALLLFYLGPGKYLTAQTGEVALGYVLPFVWQYSHGVPFLEGFKVTGKASALIEQRKIKEAQKLIDEFLEGYRKRG